MAKFMCAGCGIQVRTGAFCCEAGLVPCESPQESQVILGMRDWALLQGLLRFVQSGQFRATVVAKLDEARIVPSSEVPDDVARIDRCVSYSTDRDAPQTRILTFRHEEDYSNQALPVTTDRGLALLGMRAGSVVDLRTRNGRLERLRIEAVGQPPVARNLAGRRTDAKRPLVFPRMSANAGRLLRFPAPGIRPRRRPGEGGDGPGPAAA
jgi:regulator of nucleoside diphosphate kinase